ncbi:hypothetical protein LIA77_09179 [Sarocladium implicatum]|nr:hypothetical protein LIA77_09179 [Sarocladium implicatum]
MTSSRSASTTWQDRLKVCCRDAQIEPPAFQIVSDRRGGRTAWSSRVTVYSQTFSARYWYDGKNLHNAREDAAELAVTWLVNASSGSPTQSNASW